MALEPGGRAQLFLNVHNWCPQPPRGPVVIGVTLPSGSTLLAEPGPNVQFEPPPCNGPGQPATITVSPESWTPPTAG